MESEIKRLALTALDLVAGTATDADLVDAFVSHESAAAGASYLAGFAVQALALQRGEQVSATFQFLRAAISDEDDPGGSGVREPRRPLPSSGTGAAGHG